MKKMVNMTAWLILKILIGVVAFILAVSLLQFLISIHPSRHYSDVTPKDHGIDYEKVEFETSDGVVIKGWFLDAKKNKTVIVGHGYPFDKGNIFSAGKFLYPDYNLLFYDHRYFGESSGRITTVGAKEVRDVEAAVEFVNGRYKHNSVGLYGFSLSASVMLRIKDVKAIVADSPYSDLGFMIKDVYRFFGPLRWPFVQVTKLLTRVFLWVDVDDVSPAKSVKDSKIPILLIHGDKDSQIPVENSYRIKESNPDIELWVVEGADHMQANDDPGYEKKVKVFFGKHMR
ncbi:alpha/beta hydrolase [Nanoarchaeota archaeon]